MLLLIITLILLFGDGYYGYSNYGPSEGLVPLVLVVVVICLVVVRGGL
jgi:hypothetical protein